MGGKKVGFGIKSRAERYVKGEIFFRYGYVHPPDPTFHT